MGESRPFKGAERGGSQLLPRSPIAVYKPFAVQPLGFAALGCFAPPIPDQRTQPQALHCFRAGSAQLSSTSMAWHLLENRTWLAGPAERSTDVLRPYKDGSPT